MKSFYFFLIVIGLACFSCKEDDSISCTTCTSSQTSEFEVCEDRDGNALVNGKKTGVSFKSYIDGLQDAGASCGF